MAGVRWPLMRSEPEEPLDADIGVERLFRTQRLQLVRLAMLLVDDKETAEDVVQDAFVALHRRWSSLHNPDAAIGYLRTSVVNGSRSTLRRRRTVRAHPLPHSESLSVAAADRDVLVAAEHRQLLEVLRRLPSRQREVIVLRYWSELSEAEIATTLGISLGTVKSSASRGREAIAAALQETQRGES